MNEETWDTIMTYLPWVLLLVVGLCVYDMKRDAWHKRVQKVSHQFAKMGSNLIVKMLDAIARSDRQELVSTIDQIIETYGGDGGALKFGWDVFDFWIDDAMNDKDYADKVGRRLEQEFLGNMISEELQAKLGAVANNFGGFGLKSAQGFFQGLATGKIAPVKDALRSIVDRFTDPDRVDDELVALAPKVVAQLKLKHPEHMPAIRALVLSEEEVKKLAA